MTEVKRVTVYVELLEEGSPTIRPTEAIDNGNGLYKLLPTSGYNPEDEKWKFLPETLVRCEKREGFHGEYLHVVEQAN